MDFIHFLPSSLTTETQIIVKICILRHTGPRRQGETSFTLLLHKSVRLAGSQRLCKAGLNLFFFFSLYVFLKFHKNKILAAQRATGCAQNNNLTLPISLWILVESASQR